MLEVCGLFAALFIAVIVLYPVLFGHGIGVCERETYEKDVCRLYLRIAPPRMVFPIVWSVLYGLIIAAEIIHVLSIPSSDVDTSDMYQAIVALYVFNITLGHYWTIAFFKNRSLMFAFVISLLLFATAVAIVVLYALEGLWISFGLYMPYVVWLVYACILSLIWAISFRCDPPCPRKKCEYPCGNTRNTIIYSSS